MKKKVYPPCETCGTTASVRQIKEEGCIFLFYRKCYSCFIKEIDDQMEKRDPGDEK